MFIYGLRGTSQRQQLGKRSPVDLITGIRTLQDVASSRAGFLRGSIHSLHCGRRPNDAMVRVMENNE